MITNSLVARVKTVCNTDVNGRESGFESTRK